MKTYIPKYLVSAIVTFRKPITIAKNHQLFITRTNVLVENLGANDQSYWHAIVTARYLTQDKTFIWTEKLYLMLGSLLEVP